LHVNFDQVAAQHILVCVQTLDFDSTRGLDFGHKAYLERVRLTGHVARLELFYVRFELSVLLFDVNVQVSVRVVVQSD
jgi:hypothetical protein